MSFGWGSLLGNIGGSLIDGAFSAISAEKSYKKQKKLMQMQQAWLERMAATAHQREVADLRAAGLNPILSAGGSGASAGSSVSVPSVQGFDTDFGDLGVSSALELEQKEKANEVAAKAQASEEKTQESQQELNKANAAAARVSEITQKTQQELNLANAASAKAQAELNKKLEEKAELEKSLVKEQTKSAGKRGISEIPWEALRLWQHLFSSAKQGVDTPFNREVRNSSQSAWKDFEQSNKKSKWEPIFVEYGRSNPENNVIRNGFGY